MAALLLSRSLTTVRVLVYGALCAYIFSVSPREIPSAEITAIAVVASLGGVSLGFWLAQHSAKDLIWKLGAHNYTLVAMLGFLFGSLWATETGVVWPMLAWFAPAGVLEAFVSNVGLVRKQRAS